jgi:hypothetical protein
MMPTTRLLCAIVLASTGCDSGPSLLDREAVALGPLTFEVPTTWERVDSSHRGFMTAQFTPDDNERHESLIVLRSEQSPAVAKAGGETIRRLLVDAQRALKTPRISDVTPVITARGLEGARVDVDFSPPESTTKYRRTHVVLVEGESNALIHLLYTAQRPDPARVALTGVIDTISREE